MTKIIRTNIIILSAICFVFTACSKFNDNEMIGVAKSLSAYEKFEQDILTGRVDSSVFIYDKDFGGLYVKKHLRSTIVEEGGDLYLDNLSYVNISKTNDSGTKEWSTIWGDGVGGVSRPLISKDGNIHFIGSMASDYWSYKSFYVVLDDKGNLLLEKEFSDNLRYTIYGGFCLTNDGGALLPGGFDHYTLENPEDRISDWVLKKFNSQGDVEWTKRNGEDGIIEYAMCAIQTEDNGILAVVSRYPNNDNDLCWIEIYRTDLNGNIENQTVIYNTNSWTCDMIKANDGGYILVTIADDGSYKWEKIIITKLNSNGDILWQKSHPVGSGEVVYQYNEPSHNYYSHYIDFSVFNLMNSAYFVVDQRASDENAIKIYKFNNSGELIE